MTLSECKDYCHKKYSHSPTALKECLATCQYGITGMRTAQVTRERGRVLYWIGNKKKYYDLTEQECTDYCYKKYGHSPTALKECLATCRYGIYGIRPGRRVGSAYFALTQAEKERIEELKYKIRMAKLGGATEEATRLQAELDALEAKKGRGWEILGNIADPVLNIISGIVGKRQEPDYVPPADDRRPRLGKVGTLAVVAGVGVGIFFLVRWAVRGARKK